LSVEAASTSTAGPA